MKPKILLAVLVVAGLVLGSAYLFKLPVPAPVTETSPVQKPVGTNPQETNTAVLQKTIEPATNPAPQATGVTTNEPAPATVYASEEQHQAAIDAEKDHLSNLAMNSDPQSLSNILADLNAPDKDVRMAAIEAAKQFESTNAIPALRAAANNASSPDEAIAMLNAVQWLSTPTADLTAAAGSAGNPSLTPAQTQAINADKAKAAARQTTVQQSKAAALNGQGAGQGAASSGPNTSQNNNQSQSTSGQIGIPPSASTGQQ